MAPLSLLFGGGGHQPLVPTACLPERGHATLVGVIFIHVCVQCFMLGCMGDFMFLCLGVETPVHNLDTMKTGKG